MGFLDERCLFQELTDEKIVQLQSHGQELLLCLRERPIYHRLCFHSIKRQHTRL